MCLMHLLSSFPNYRLLRHSVVAVLIITVLLSGAFGSSVTHAAGGIANFSLQPIIDAHSASKVKTYFVLDGHPGTLLQGSVRVKNGGTATGTVSLYGVDATTGQTSGTVYLSRNDPRRDVGAWLILSVQLLTLAPGQSQVVPFEVAIPSIVRPGQHLGGIVAENMQQVNAAQSSSLQINLRKLTIVAVQVNIPGTVIEQMIATNIQAGGSEGYQTLELGLSNTGTVMLKPAGSLQVADTDGHLLQNLSLKLNTFLPQTSINYPVNVQSKALGVGTYQARLTLTYGHGHVLNYMTTFTVTLQQLKQVFKNTPPLPSPDLGGNFFDTLSPWHFVIGLVLLVMLISSLLFWGQRLRRLVSVSPSRSKGKKQESKKVTRALPQTRAIRSFETNATTGGTSLTKDGNRKSQAGALK
jgi:hypothetical protein